jgi:molybdate transport system permease protein
VSAAFAVRTMRVTFEQQSPRTEQVARTLGCTLGQAFWRVSLPEAMPGVVSAAALAWARALGEFGPVLVFAGVTRGRTEVMTTTVFLELSVGNVQAALAVSVLMIGVSAAVLAVLRLAGPKAG